MALDELVPGALWLREYGVKLGGARFNARMTVIRLGSGELVVQSPCAFDAPLTAEVGALGRVAAIVAPGNFHWLHVPSCQQAFPDARTFVCPGIDERAKNLRYDAVLGDDAPALWAGELAQVAVVATRVMREVAFFHRASRTLILVDLIENFTSATPGTNWLLRAAFRAVGMWNRATPAPEYKLGWGDKARVRDAMQRIVAWDFERVVLSHGDLITQDAKATVVRAWRKILA